MRKVYGKESGGDAARLRERAEAVLRPALGVRLALPGNPDYDFSRQVFNRAIDRRPSIVARVTGVDEIKRVLSFASQERVSVSVRGGGHGGGLSAVNDEGILIDLRPMNAVAVDAQQGRAIVQGGALLLHLDNAANAQGWVAVTGLCPLVGAAGYTLGGGLSLLSQRCGLACDNLLAADLVTADGRTLSLGDGKQDDLFWAIRGGGAGNFGIVSQFTVTLHDLPEMMTGGIVTWAYHDAHGVIRRYAALMSEASDDWSAALALRFAPDGSPVVHLIGLHMGEPGLAERVWREVRSWAKPAREDVRPRRYLEFQQLYGSHISQSPSYGWRNGFLSGSLDGARAEVIVDMFGKNPNRLGRVNLEPFRGAINRVPLDDTAFYHRNQSFLWSAIALWEDDDAKASGDWLREFQDRMRPHLSGMGFQSYYDSTDPDLDPASRCRAYFGEHLERLRRLKRRYDPDDRFQGLIRP